MAAIALAATHLMYKQRAPGVPCKEILCQQVSVKWVAAFLSLYEFVGIAYPNDNIIRQQVIMTQCTISMQEKPVHEPGLSTPEAEFKREKVNPPKHPILDGFSPSEIADIVQLKRFFEWTGGDKEFEESVNTGSFSAAQLERLQKIGVTFDVNELSILWKDPQLFAKVMQLIMSGDQALPADLAGAIAPDSLPALWLRYSARKGKLRRRSLASSYRIPQNQHFDAWRQRRIASTRSELGFFGRSIDHPILALEMGDGCSVGCWFCAFAARKLTTNLDYEKNRDYFRSIVQDCADMFGRKETAMTLLYYGTEPHDNPHFLDYVKDHMAITGHATCTSTTAAHDATWVRELISFYRSHTLPWPRFSVLSKSLLYQIHDTYTPDELRDVELLMQMKEHSRQKVSGGRILEENNGMRGKEDGHYLDEIIPQGSIACVTGFLINLVNKTIQIVSPCYTSTKWPFGYRVFGTATFSGAEDFQSVMQGLIEKHMPLTIVKTAIARFRDDLKYRPSEQGFDLVSPNQIHHFTGPQLFKPLGDLIAQGTLTYQQVLDTLVDTLPTNPMLISSAVTQLFDGGFLDEVGV